MPDSETKICQNCRASFAIDASDLDFYRKISVPPPTFCPDCRMQRRFAWRNERTLYRNTCAATGKPVISCFAPDSGLTVYDRDYWWSDNWDPFSFGTDYDFQRPFFAQFSELLRRVPMPAVFSTNTVNCNYCNYVGEMKDAYLVGASWAGENLAYASREDYCKDSMDLFGVMLSERCYDCVSVLKSSQTYFSQNCESCSACALCLECRGCNDCVGCVNLRNKSYHIFNQPYDRESYRQALAELRLDTQSGLAAARQRFEELKLRSLRKFANITSCQNVTGDYIANAANCRFIFDSADDVRDCRYCQNIASKAYGCYDGYGIGAQCELTYESFNTGVQGVRQCFCGTVYGGTDIYYSINCHNCMNLFGCVGLRNKEYCIFNRQYGKEEYRELRARIIRQMSDRPYVSKVNSQKSVVYKYGEFYPIELSPFAYNATVAQDFMPLSPDKIRSEGYTYREPEVPPYQATIAAQDLPDSIQDATEAITKEIISCQGCGKVYRIISKELSFLEQAGLPLPRRCPECRHQDRLALRNPMKLWHRHCACGGRGRQLNTTPSQDVVASCEGVVCQNTAKHFHGEAPCPNEFETAYPPDSPAIIYCEQCYNAEVV
ncbi:MAG: hypothetical protein HY978_02915 [Candidatus Liptonbacteria bacterium]|nr:hypothetical protein [Candidatus Liptonbacteria bacterium]